MLFDVNMKHVYEMFWYAKVLIRNLPSIFQRSLYKVLKMQTRPRTYLRKKVISTAARGVCAPSHRCRMLFAVN